MQTAFKLSDADTICSSPSVPTNALLIGPAYNIYMMGVNITLQCINRSQVVLQTVCHANGSWQPPPSELDCNLPGVAMLAIAKFHGMPEKCY